MFAIGEKVVCISDLKRNIDDIENGVIYPIKNEIYTIREFFEGNGIRLNEIINPKLQYKDGFNECAFYLKHFRKLDYDFAENLLSEITRQVKEEEKVLRRDREQEAQKQFSKVLKKVWKW